MLQKHMGSEYDSKPVSPMMRYSTSGENDSLTRRGFLQLHKPHEISAFMVEFANHVTGFANHGRVSRSFGTTISRATGVPSEEARAVEARNRSFTMFLLHMELRSCLHHGMRHSKKPHACHSMAYSTPLARKVNLWYYHRTFAR